MEELELPTHVQSVLVRAGIETAGQLLEKTPAEVLAISGFGQKSLEEVRARLDERGWNLRGDAFEGEEEEAEAAPSESAEVQEEI